MTEKSSNLNNSNQYNPLGLHKSNKAKVSYITSELINHIDSLESLTFISNLLVSSLEEYKKKIVSKSCIESNESFFSQNNKNIDEDKDLQNNLKDSREEFLAISNDIHLILSNNTELTNTQKLDFCNNQRYFMKLYLKKMLIEINKS